MQEESQECKENTIRKIMKENAMTLVWVVGVVFSFLMFVVFPQQEIKTNISLIQQSIGTIEKNHLKHIEDYALEIKEMKQEQADLEKQQLEVLKSLERTLTILELNK